MGNPRTGKAAGVSPSGDAHGASIRSGLREHNRRSGCGSARADTHSLEPVPRGSCSTSVSCSFPGMSFRKAPAPLGPHAAIFPREGTLQEDRQPAVFVRSRSSTDCPPRQTPQALYPSPSYAASWLRRPSVSYASPSDPFLEHWPRQLSPYNQSCLPYLCISSTPSHPKGVACLPETQRQSPAFIWSEGWPTFVQHLGWGVLELARPASESTDPSVSKVGNLRVWGFPSQTPVFHSPLWTSTSSSAGRKHPLTPWPHSCSLAQCMHTMLANTFHYEWKRPTGCLGCGVGSAGPQGREVVQGDKKQAFPEASSLAWVVGRALFP